MRGKMVRADHPVWTGWGAALGGNTSPNAPGAGAASFASIFGTGSSNGFIQPQTTGFAGSRSSRSNPTIPTASSKRSLPDSQAALSNPSSQMQPAPAISFNLSRQGSPVARSNLSNLHRTLAHRWSIVCPRSSRATVRKPHPL